MKIKHLVQSIKDTKKIAKLLAKYLSGKIILLNGDIGAGKTTFSGFFINALCNDSQVVTSPTFPIIQSYDTSIGIVHHLDLYRIENENDLQNLGIDEILLDTCLIEWSEKLKSYTPKHFVKITIYTLNKNSREILIEFSSKYKKDYEEIFKEMEHINVI